MKLMTPELVAIQNSLNRKRHTSGLEVYRLFYLLLTLRRNMPETQDGISWSLVFFLLTRK